MDIHLLALQLMAAQALLGAFDTIYHHELTEALPNRPGARLELAIHATRALIYAALFIGLSTWRWHGAWAVLLLVLFGIEIVLTLWDFVVEDKTRLLPATERVTHTVLAINGGAFIMLLILNTPAWFAMPTAVVWQPHGWLSIFLALAGVGVGLSGLRDAYAARALRMRDSADYDIHFAGKPQHVLVTGATGFIGQHVVRALLNDGHQVTVLTRQPKAAAWSFDAQVRCVKAMGDLPITTHIDIIINLAGARVLGWPWTAKRRAVLQQSRIGLTQSVVDWIARAEHKPRLLLSASAIGYYGIQQHGDQRELSEADTTQPIFMSALCRDWEAAANAAHVHGVKVICMRFGLVLGRQGPLPMMLLPIKLFFGGRLGSGRQWLSWIHIDDLVRGIAFLCDRAPANNVPEAYNFTAPEVVTQAEFTRVAANVMGRPYWMPTPAAPVRLLLGEQADLLLEGQHVVPQRLRESGFGFRFPDTRSALLNLCRS